MKKFEGYYYEITSTNDNCKTGSRHEAFDSAVQELEDIVQRAKHSGYNNDEKWLIVCVEWQKLFDENGMFISETTSRRASALYDNGKIENL